MSVVFERELISAYDRYYRQSTAHIDQWNFYQFFEFCNDTDAYLSRPTNLCLTQTTSAVWDFKNTGTFSQNLIYPYKHVRIFVPAHVWMEGPRILKSDLNWASHGQIFGGFPPFCILAPRDQTCQFFVGPENYIFWGVSFNLRNNMAALAPKKLQGFETAILVERN